ncbi:peptidylprolyl isomerase [Myxococcus hansupus]|uniref:peptidylprolyl isomerase n=1 Tax=Pseudomyxococcus hansupus TaxID=1297742 RepID=UPI0005D0F9B3|nr:peptidylprolyl isomerase [Myxococcus hansupus]
MVAQVGRTELRRADVQEFASRRAGEITADAQLDELIDQARLSERAVALGLDAREETRARLAAARREVLMQALLQEELKSVTSEADLLERYESSKSSLARRQIHVRQVVIRLPPGDGQPERRQAGDRANMIYARLMGGEPFEVVAREASQDDVSAAQGGDLGIVREGQVHPAFFEAAAALKKGELSKPFETPYGIHVVQALEHMQSVLPTFNEVRGRLAAEARREAESRLMKELEASIPVKRFPDALSAPATNAPKTGDVTR